MQIRRIVRDDCNSCFETGYGIFDYSSSGEKLDLMSYYDRDSTGEYESYVGIERGKIVGILCIQRQNDSFYVSRLGVLKGQHCKGYGAELATHAIKRAMECGLRKITCKAHKKVWGFFLSAGFKETSRDFDAWWGEYATFKLEF